VGSGVLVVLLDGRVVNLDALGFDNATNLGQTLASPAQSVFPSHIVPTHSVLVADQIGVAQSIGLGNNGNQVNAGAEALHHLNVERLEGVSGGSDEVQAGVHTHVDLVGTAGLLLLEHVGFVLVIQELNDGLPGITVVDVVTEAGGINNGQANCKKRVLSAFPNRRDHGSSIRCPLP
jgi:hypothetical protein